MWLSLRRKGRACLKWLLECQSKSPKNPSFSGFYNYTFVESSQQHIHIRMIDLFLKLCSYLYLCGLKVHRGWYRYGLGKSSQLYLKEPNGSKRQVFTFAVGNYTWGGTGKTPFVIFLSRLLVSRGYQPVILSRGYGYKDEAKMMIRQGVASHVISGSNREEAFQNAFSSVVPCSSMVVILDDGLQHWRLNRQFNILMVNAALAFGINGHLIPRGSLREPPCQAASRSTCIVLHHCNQVSNFQLQQLKTWFQIHCPEKPILTSFMLARSLYCISPQGKLDACSLDAITNQYAVLCCGIEYPNGLLQTILKYCHPKQLHIESLVDHHWFVLQELIEIVLKWNSFYASWNLIITEKDYYRNEDVFHQLVQYRNVKRHVQVYIVKAELQIHSGIQTFSKLLDKMGLSPIPSKSDVTFI
ncbi:hypothetical protein GpartN1_g5659.t1 [Galdieria partita]|uniref:tetraacyldisaccharide 4'-kinase n=1 Tax=Galdieria partita TaxID=83374 RepID=A0A9C7USI5_9RHOD|nr:hypothetical protein GpartN1_g5659.t1 [Galdieria partita]